ncbi:hypothetical protein [Flavobacterium alvei]|uniref:hypothetical protein n=1 Tax=Flavobacterium alvei TaxID=2080416 RepID=UPI0026EA0BB9|nr:hypothetical protein [Flavobacterium alvei]
MKLIAQLLLILFIAFLITPTVVCVIKKDADISTFYSFSEEEKAQKEIKAIINLDLNCTTVDVSPFNCKIILSENTSKHDTISSKIFIPPPDQA